MENKRGLNKKSQVTLFIIFGLLILVSILAFFFLFPSPKFESTKKSSIEPYLEVKPCISKSLENVLPEFLEKGMYFNPPSYLVYKGKNVSYHCYTSQKRTICTRNDAQSKRRIEEELENKIRNDVEKCFQEMKEKNKGFNIEMKETDFSVEIQPKRIYLKVRKPIEISKSDEGKLFFENFDVYVNSNIWDYIQISNEIINQEVTCNCPMESCTADTIKLMSKYNDYKVIFFIGSRGEKVYTIEDYTEKKNTFHFAIKNCDKTP
ncbi:MAG: hypothetical protein QXX68_00355 [Candidatus Pacearchaeota archaeon]